MWLPRRSSSCSCVSCCARLINSGHKKYQLMVVDKEGRDVVHVIDDVSAKHHPKYLVLGQFGRKVRLSLAHTVECVEKGH